MYWEPVWDMYEMASNQDIIEKNEEMKFNYILHAQKKDALEDWKDLPIPFPDRVWQENMKTKIDANKKAASSVPVKLRGLLQSRGSYRQVKGTPEDTKRFQEVRARVQATQAEAKRKKEEWYFGQYFKK